MQNNKEQYLSIGEASEYLGVSIDTLRRWTKKGKLTAFLSPGNHRYFTKSHLDSVFGTRYERKEADKPQKAKEEASQETAPESQGSASQVGQSGPETSIPHLDDPSIYLAHEMDFVAPEEDKKPEEVTVPSEKQPLNVPRFIRRQSISKYDFLLQSREYANHKELTPPDTAGKISEHTETPTTPVNFEIKNIKSILTPPQVNDISEHKARVVVVEEKEENQDKKAAVKKQGNLDIVLKRIFLGFLALDIILFVFWFATQRINSPLP